ncbi:MAG: DnaB-like helicase C-terminal domain-containing protein [Nanoarchaeota archaeon]|nr:DnaB-like helicase C-terminal domain-containing protein [Nanoarchaeota archaeon]
MIKTTFDKEAAYRKQIDPDRLCKYGVDFLDEALTCILPNDLVVIGAESGAGKSELSLQIAAYNAKRGKKVALFFLEGGDVEAMARMKWKDLCMLYKMKHENSYMPVNYVEWRTNRYSDPSVCSEFASLERELGNKYNILYGENLYIPEINGEFTLNSLISGLWDYHTLEFAIKTGKQYNLDLIIIDHLQYFDLVDETHEIQATTKILKECKRISDIAGVPVVLVSHLRKMGKDSGLPSHEDFYGTGNISKIASTAIMISRDNSQSDYSRDYYYTYFRVVKSRIGLSSNYAAKLIFDGKTRDYKKEYELYLVNRSGYVANDPIEHNKMPRWAKSARGKMSEHEQAVTEIRNPEKANWND